MSSHNLRRRRQTLEPEQHAEQSNQSPSLNPEHTDSVSELVQALASLERVPSITQRPQSRSTESPRARPASTTSSRHSSGSYTPRQSTPLRQVSTPDDDDDDFEENLSPFHPSTQAIESNSPWPSRVFPPLSFPNTERRSRVSAGRSSSVTSLSSGTSLLPYDDVDHGSSHVENTGNNNIGMTFYSPESTETWTQRITNTSPRTPGWGHATSRMVETGKASITPRVPAALPPKTPTIPTLDGLAGGTSVFDQVPLPLFRQSSASPSMAPSSSTTPSESQAVLPNIHRRIDQTPRIPTEPSHRDASDSQESDGSSSSMSEPEDVLENNNSSNTTNTPTSAFANLSLTDLSSGDIARQGEVGHAAVNLQEYGWGGPPALGERLCFLIRLLLCFTILCIWVGMCITAALSYLFRRALLMVYGFLVSLGVLQD